jgi:hypothetical protein
MKFSDIKPLGDNFDYERFLENKPAFIIGEKYITIGIMTPDLV